MATSGNSAVWAVRIAFAAVFAVNVQCALSFVMAPDDYAAGFMLGGAGAPGEAAIAGLGVAFLMWNATYPALIASPRRFPVLGWVVLAQQAIGLAGESFIFIGLDPGLEPLRAAVMRFIVFDAVGLALMAATFLWFTLSLYCDKVPFRIEGERKA